MAVKVGYLSHRLQTHRPSRRSCIHRSPGKRWAQVTEVEAERLNNDSALQTHFNIVIEPY